MKISGRILFLFLLLFSLIGVLTGIPLSLKVLRFPYLALFWAALEFFLLMVPAVIAGVWLEKKAGLAVLPESRECMKRGLVAAAAVGAVLGGIALASQNAMPAGTIDTGPADVDTLAWSLQCVSASLTEEIFFRFGLMTFVAWVVRALARKPGITGTSLWIGNLVAALLFAGAHVSQIALDNLVFSIPVLVFSACAGLLMGWLYMRYSLLSAVLAHLIADLVVYVIPPAFS